ncbi:unnamed protein product, partial [Brassica napus]
TTGGIAPSRATMVRYTTLSSQSCNSIDTLISFCLNLHYLHKHRNSSFLHHRRLRFRRRHQQIHNKSRSRFCCLRSAITGGGAHAAFSLAVGVPDFNALTSGLIAPARRSNQLLVLVAEGEFQDGGYSVLLEEHACFCSSMEHEEESKCDTRYRIKSSEFSTAQERKSRRLSEEVVGTSPDLSLLQTLKAEEEEEWLTLKPEV